MKIAIIGTGMVGQALAAQFSELGHQVTVGTRNVAATLAKTEADGMGNPPFSAWIKGHTSVVLKTFAEAASQAELVVNATSGHGSLEALKLAGTENLAGKILMDIANPLDFSQGMPPFLFVANQDSLGEQIQKTFPEAKVVKTLNIVTAALMVNPGMAAGGDHSMFVSGNDAQAKATVISILKDFGWKDIIDLGDITNARGTEMLLPIWIRTWGAIGTPFFGFKIAR